MNEDDPVTLPSLGGFDREDAAVVHEASMRLVEERGVRLDDERARELVAAAGGTVHEDGVVTLPRDLVERNVGRAPPQFTLHARNPDNDVVVGDGGPVRAPGYGPANVRTYGDGRRRARLADYETLVKLAQLESAIDCTGYNVCDPADVPEDVKHLEMVRRSLTLTDQPVMGATYGRERARSCLELVGIAMDDPDLSRPCVAGLVNTVPPRGRDISNIKDVAERSLEIILDETFRADLDEFLRLNDLVRQADEQGRQEGLKISLFDVSDVSAPREVASWESDSEYVGSAAEYEHKAFLLDKANDLMVVPAYSYDRREGGESYNGALVFDVSSSSVELRGLVDHGTGERYGPSVERSFTIEELLYTKSPSLLRINSIDDLGSVKQVDLRGLSETDVPVY